MPGREHAGVRTRDILTPSAFSIMDFHLYSPLGARLELRGVERTPCLHPSDSMSSYRIPCPPTDQCLAPTCCAPPAACGLCSAVRTWLPMVWIWVQILPKAQLYDMWNGQLPGRYTTRSVHDHPRSVQMGGAGPRKRSHNCSSSSGRRCHGTGARDHFWSLPAGDTAGALVARRPPDSPAAAVPGDVALSRRAARPPGDQS